MKWLGYLVLVLTELAVYNQLSALGNPSGAIYGYLVLLLIMTFVAIFFHEMGHALTVWHVGGTVHSIVVSFVRYNVARKRLEPAPRSRSREVGGYVSYAFERRLGTPRKEMIIAAAGPVANLMTALAAFLLVLALNPAHTDRASAPLEIVMPLDNSAATRPPAVLPDDQDVRAAFEQVRQQENAEFWQTMLKAFATLSVGLALANLVPFQGSDGAAILRNWRKPKQHFGMR